MSAQDAAPRSRSIAPHDAVRPSARPSLPTRTSRAWGWISFGLVSMVVFVVFALQNLTSVRVNFFGVHGELPLAVLLLVVAVFGALVVFAFGAARIIQLRLDARRVNRKLSASGE